VQLRSFLSKKPEIFQRFYGVTVFILKHQKRNKPVPVERYVRNPHTAARFGGAEFFHVYLAGARVLHAGPGARFHKIKRLPR